MTPADPFTWGVATSAYQIEGGRREGGKGDSIWDRFADAGRMPESGDVACDHYHRWREDVALLAELGVTAYRFSIAWTRIQPDGRGAPLQAGIDFYQRLIDALLEAEIEPWPTLYHWDLPQALEDAGGWPERDSAERFAAYADIMSRALGDRVQHWITHNEPWVVANLGYRDGVFAPGRTDEAASFAAAHHLLLSHGMATRAIRANVAGASVGIALDCRPVSPATGNADDIVATTLFDGARNRWFFDPVFGRGYPIDVVDDLAARRVFHGGTLPFLHNGDLDVIAEPIDFLGLNYYTSLKISAGDDQPEGAPPATGEQPPAGFTAMGWENTPGALTDYLRHIATEYAPDRILITENGASYSDGPDGSGAIDDERRIDYLRSHIAAVEDARSAGVPVFGYFVWSLLDNLEWVAGYSQRFGLVWVDHATGRRIPKASYEWYRTRIATDGPSR